MNKENKTTEEIIREKLKSEEKILVLVPSRHRTKQIYENLKNELNDNFENIKISQFEDFIILLYGKKYINIMDILELPRNWWELYIISLLKQQKEIQNQLPIYEYKRINEFFITGKKISSFIRDYLEYKFPKNSKDVDDIFNKNKQNFELYTQFFDILKTYLDNMPIDEFKCFYDVINNFDNYKEELNIYSFLILENLNSEELSILYRSFIEKICKHFENKCEKVSFIIRPNPDNKNNITTLCSLLDEIKKDKKNNSQKDKKLNFFYGITALDEIQWMLEKIADIIKNEGSNKSICIVCDDETFISQIEFSTEIYNSIVKNENEKIKIKKEFSFKFHIVWQMLNSIANYLRGYFTKRDLELLLSLPVSKFKIDTEIYDKYIHPYLMPKITSEELYLDLKQKKQLLATIRKVIKNAIKYQSNATNMETEKIKKAFKTILDLFSKLEELRSEKFKEQQESILYYIIENFFVEFFLENADENIKRIFKEAKKVEEKIQKNEALKNLLTFGKFDFILRYLALQSYNEEKEGIYLLPPSEAQFLKFYYVFIPNMTEKIERSTPLYLSDKILDLLELPNSQFRSIMKKIHILNCIKNAEFVYLSSHKVEQKSKELYHSIILEELNLTEEKYDSSNFLFNEINKKEKQQ